MATGPIPPELGMLRALTRLHLYDNQLEGDVGVTVSIKQGPIMNIDLLQIGCVFMRDHKACSGCPWPVIQCHIAYYTRKLVAEPHESAPRLRFIWAGCFYLLHVVFTLA